MWRVFTAPCFPFPSLFTLSYTCGHTTLEGFTCLSKANAPAWLQGSHHHPFRLSLLHFLMHLPLLLKRLIFFYKCLHVFVCACVHVSSVSAEARGIGSSGAVATGDRKPPIVGPVR